jgi:hypothetical protein
MLLASALLGGCFIEEPGRRYPRGTPSETEQTLVSHHEVWVKHLDGKGQTRLGYVKKYSLQLPGEWHRRYRHVFINDQLTVIGQLHDEGELFRFVEGELKLISRYMDFEHALKVIYEQPFNANVYISQVNPYRDN